MNIYCKIPNVIGHALLAINSKVLPASLTDLSSWVGSCTSIPQQGVKFQLRYLGGGGGSL